MWFNKSTSPTSLTTCQCIHAVHIIIDKGTKHGSGTSRQRQEDQTSHNKFALLPYQRLSLKAEKKTRGLNRIAYAKHVTTASVD
jgi:hypothetical protein